MSNLTGVVLGYPTSLALSQRKKEVFRSPPSNPVCLFESCVFPVEPQRTNSKNMNLHKKLGFPPIPQRVPKGAEKCGNPHFLRKNCAESAVCRTFWHSFWNRRKPQLFVQIDVFAVRVLRLDRKYTISVNQVRERQSDPESERIF